MYQQRMSKAATAIVTRRIEKAEAYLGCVLDARKCGLSDAEVSLVAERLEACEEFVTLAGCDWDRVCAIVLPERKNKAFRDYAAQTLGQWSRFVGVVCPEDYGESREAAGTDELPGSPAKVEVMVRRAERRSPVFSRKDADVGENDGMLAEAGSNGTLDARTTRGRATKRLLVMMKGSEKVVIGKDVEPTKPDWYKMRPPTGVRLMTPAAVAEEEQPAKKKPGRKPKKVEDANGGWLPFLNLEGGD